MQDNFFHTQASRLSLLMGIALLLASCAAPSGVEPKIEVTPPSQIPTQPTIIETKPKETPKHTVEEPVFPVRIHTQIATLLPLSGASSAVGQDILRGAELALYRYAEQDFTLKVYDTQGRRLTALQAARAAIADGADAVIGPLFSHTTKAVAPLFQQAGIPIFSLSNSDTLLDQPTASVSRDRSFYLLGITPREELKNLIEVGFLQGLQRYALIAPDDEYGRRIQQGMQQSLNARGAEFARAGYYDPTSIDFSAVVQQVSDFRERRRAYKNEVQKLIADGVEDEDVIAARLEYKETYGDLPFDAMLMVTYDDNSLRTLAAQLEFYEVEPERVQYMGLSQWQNYPNLHQEPSLRGSWHVGLDPKTTKQFQGIYRQAYGQEANIFAALGYDALAMLAHASKQNPHAPIQVLQGMRDGIRGATGAFRLEQGGTVARKMAVFQINEQGVEVLLDADKSWGFNLSPR